MDKYSELSDFEINVLAGNIDFKLISKLMEQTPIQSLEKVKAQAIKDMCDIVAGYSGQFGETVLRLEDIKCYADTLLTHGDSNE